MMTSPRRPYRIMLALSEARHAKEWIRLALQFLPEGGEICLRGMITIPPDHSLSEGVLRAQRMRETFLTLAEMYRSVIPIENWIRVDYRPLGRILDEFLESPADLILVDWQGPHTVTGGMLTDELLQSAPCDLCLLTGDLWERCGPVLLTLRGGPNLTLGLSLARALAPEGQVSLLHVHGEAEQLPDLQPLLETNGAFGRVITVRERRDVQRVIQRESIGHRLIIMGASQYEQAGSASFLGQIVERTYAQTSLPVAVVRAWQPEELTFHKPRLFPRREESLSTRVDRWFAENSFDAEEFRDRRLLLEWKEKQGVTISLGLPALNEAATVGQVITTLKTALMDEVPLVDEIVLIDSSSTDDTVRIAQECGIPTYVHAEILPEVGSVAGKGEALWKSLHVLRGDIIAWVDTDIVNIHPRFVYGLLGPLLKHPHIQYVKGYYNRPIMVDDRLKATGGGRVTELVARPFFSLFYPELSGLVQPLAGEYAGRRSALERVPFFSGYGVETGLLIDLHALYGLDAIAQSDLKERIHHNQPLEGLSRMAFAILQVFMTRLEDRYGVELLDKANRSLKYIVQAPEHLGLEVSEIADKERPPMITIPAYRQRRR